MRSSPLALAAMDIVLDNLEEGIHIVDSSGVSVLYNKAMEKIEGLSAQEVLGRHLLEVFPSWTAADSTLLTALATGSILGQRKQSYLNFKKKLITTLNTTYPLFGDSGIVGAVEISKNYTEVNQLSEKLIDLQQRLRSPAKAASKKSGGCTFGMLIGEHPLFLRAVDIAMKAAKTDSNVLIEGETGTGKELFAQSIHNGGSRSAGPFIAVNCAAMPDSLLEGIFFGTTRGSYTGAEDRPGLFEQASGGSLFLDEINSMSLALQAKILRVIQECSVRRLGGLKDLSVDLRIIAASNEPLRSLTEENRFRKDLYYRIKVIGIELPALRDRGEDIGLLIEHFTGLYNKKLSKNVQALSPELTRLFRDCPWEGNVRELQNAIESSMALMGDERVLGLEHLPPHVDPFGPVKNRAAPKKDRADAKRLMRGAKAGDNLADSLEKLEKNMIAHYLETTGGNIAKAAHLAGISRQRMQYRIKKLRLDSKKR